MDIDEKISEINKKFVELTNEQRELKNRVSALVDNKRELKKNFIIGLIDNKNELDDIFKISNEINGGEKNITELDNLLVKLYNKAFHGIVHGRIKTTYKFTEEDKRRDWENNIWINSRGIAFKPIPSYWNNHTDATKMLWDTNLAFKIIKEHPQLTRFIKRDDKKEIFKAFRKCLLGWKSFKDIKDSIYEHTTNLIKTDDDYSLGISGLSSRQYEKVKIISNISGITIKFMDDSGSYYGHNVKLWNDISPRDLYMVSQLTPEMYEDIRNRLEESSKVFENNKKLYAQLMEDVSPYILHRVI